MKLASLFSGGKDSVLGLYKASAKHDVVCLITIESENKESYMFHTPNISLTQTQSEALDLPLIKVVTKGEKEKELAELKQAIQQAIDEYQIEGIVTGTVASTYQASRVQKICNELDIWCFNPLWQMDQIELLNDLIENKFEVYIAGVFAYPFGEEWLGKIIDKSMIGKLKQMQEELKINPAGEGGEIETFVTDCPAFKKKIIITKYSTEYDNYAGVFNIEETKLEEK
ncbi:diphthine--ammonia ligase [Candidatus Woesearchaeota archaeon]|jgi:diphthine-ammonia ligase|nr:diphthine--ammonia ligase [Candidatus Woesearchaeota archaeon]MBT3537786.1 diphthine--ammonia ligase [Candidatus Woesearchaeota archaeon]MBT4697917.1 diphthine--ammonia ligase [Candidatus Woesearchaeota archaeon]MBT4717310.1 diphthine--ammonia ligase [Candidatus Woesearchaeota archaeon]MBT7105455.1 diphthine--ammonia ligase [Candidatus Woesearchaeota archaeon]